MNDSYSSIFQFRLKRIPHSTYAHRFLTAYRVCCMLLKYSITSFAKHSQSIIIYQTNERKWMKCAKVWVESKKDIQNQLGERDLLEWLFDLPGYGSAQHG